MIGLLKRQLEVWRWVGGIDLDLSSLPVTIRQAPAPLNAALLVVAGFGGFAAGALATAVLLSSGELSVASALLLALPSLCIGAGLLYLAALSYRSGRDLAFASDGVTVRGRWFRRMENWFAPYSAFDGVEARAQRILRGSYYRTFYVIELRHPEPEKSIPLFVCAAAAGPSEEVFQQKAKNYAQTLDVASL
ncbi:hypothetical protein [Pelagibius sp.]|uniref:hypothetical protein n=1 Tax=Pelagibius sp. TaxID=1931238 RepID=UPI003B50DB04